MNYLIIIGIIYVIIGLFWTIFQLWRWPANIVSGDVLQHYSLTLNSGWSISKKQKFIQTVFWLPILIIQIITINTVYKLSCKYYKKNILIRMCLYIK